MHQLHDRLLSTGIRKWSSAIRSCPTHSVSEAVSSVFRMRMGGRLFGCDDVPFIAGGGGLLPVLSTGLPLAFGEAAAFSVPPLHAAAFSTGFCNRRLLGLSAVSDARAVSDVSAATLTSAASRDAAERRSAALQSAVAFFSAAFRAADRRAAVCFSGAGWCCW